MAIEYDKFGNPISTPTIAIGSVVVDPLTGRQFTVGSRMDTSLDTTQAYQRAISAFQPSSLSSPIQNPITPANLIVTDPVTGRQFGVGERTDMSLDTTQAYQRAISAPQIDNRPANISNNPVPLDFGLKPITPGGLQPVTPVTPMPTISSVPYGALMPEPATGSTVTDPVTGRQFVVGQPTDQSLNTTQAYQRAISAPQSASLGSQPAFTPIATTTIPGGTGDIVAGLPAARGETAGTSRIDPALRPYLDIALRRAEQLFLGQPQPTLYPGQMYVGPSEQTLAALTQQEEAARAAAPVLSAAQQAYTSALGATTGATPLYRDIFAAARTQPGVPAFEQAAGGQFINPALAGTQQVAGGAFLGGSPFRESLIQAATRPLVQQFGETVLPGIASGFSRAGRYGSGAMEQAQARATEAFGRSLGDVASSIAAQDYARERAFQEAARTQLGALGQQDVATRLAGAAGLQQAQQAALATQLAATGGLGTIGGQEIARQAALAQAAPSFFQASFLPSQALAQVGAAREQIAAQPLQEAIQRYQFSQQLPYQQLQGFLSSVYGTPMSASQYAPIPQAQTNRLASALGGAGLGYLGGQFLGGTTFGLPSSTVGAGLGAILGGLL